MWSLVVLFLVVSVSIAWAVPAVEARLDRQSRARLLDAGVDASTLNLRWNYRNLTVNGELPADTSVEQLSAILRQDMEAQSPFFADGIRQMVIDIKPSSVTEPSILSALADAEFAVTATVDENTALLEGIVQTTLQRHTLVNALLESGVENISDNLDVLPDNIARSGGDAKVDALAEMLAFSGPDNVVAVVANLDKTNLNYRVTAKHQQAATDIENAADIAMIDFNVNGETSFVRDGAVDVLASSDGTTITLSGQVLSEQQQRRLLFAANEAIGDPDKVRDQLEVTDKMASVVGTDDRVNELATVLSRFAKGVRGEVKMNGTQMSLIAAVNSESEREGFSKVAASARSNGLEVQEKISVAQPVEQVAESALQQKLDSLADEIRLNVVFSSGDSTLSEAAKTSLNQVVDIINAYPGLQVEVEGHTDNVGRDSVNEQLSQSRANEVKDYLVSQSVPEQQLVAVGYGHRLPVASNDTPEGRRQNRRVYFNVVTEQTTR